VIILRLPPLRERGEDILFLAEHFLRRFNAKYGKAAPGFDPRAREDLLAYPWPGNVRELSHVVERAVLWSQGSLLGSELLSLEIPAAPAQPDGRGDSEALPATGTDLESWERTLIERALRESDGNQTRAAQRLGISRDTLRYRLKKYGIQGLTGGG
jgi:DNA-binding NtrC family response regulator